MDSGTPLSSVETQPPSQDVSTGSQGGDAPCLVSSTSEAAGVSGAAAVGAAGPAAVMLTRKSSRRTCRAAVSAPVVRPRGRRSGPLPAGEDGAGSALHPSPGVTGKGGCSTGVFSTNSQQATPLPESVPDTPGVLSEQLRNTNVLPAPDSASSGAKSNTGHSCSPVATGADSCAASGAGQTAVCDESPRPDCGICLEPCLHPVKLPCGHVFCFLCVKGAVKQSQRCAYCRADVPLRYLNNPKLLDDAEFDREMAAVPAFQWMYQGRNGWWRYDTRTSREIEAAFTAQQTSLQIQVAGELYTVDLAALTQYSAQCRGRRRRIRRDSAAVAAQCKGVAGLRKRQRRQ